MADKALYVGEEYHDFVKVYAAVEKTKIKAVIESLIDDYLKRGHYAHASKLSTGERHQP